MLITEQHRVHKLKSTFHDNYVLSISNATFHVRQPNIKKQVLKLEKLMFRVKLHYFIE